LPMMPVSSAEASSFSASSKYCLPRNPSRHSSRPSSWTSVRQMPCASTKKCSAALPLSWCAHSSGVRKKMLRLYSSVGVPYIAMPSVFGIELWPPQQATR
jgi:hypothetical protein